MEKTADRIPLAHQIALELFETFRHKLDSRLTPEELFAEFKPIIWRKTRHFHPSKLGVIVSSSRGCRINAHGKTIVELGSETLTTMSQLLDKDWLDKSPDGISFLRELACAAVMVEMIHIFALEGESA